MARPPKRKRLSPPERKVMSLSKDRRGDWWGKRDAKGVRGRTRAAHQRVARREDARLLIDDPDEAEARFAAKQRRRWKKSPGHSLADEIARSGERRHSAYRRKDRTFVKMKLSEALTEGRIPMDDYAAAIARGMVAIEAGASRIAALRVALGAVR